MAVGLYATENSSRYPVRDAVENPTGYSVPVRIHSDNGHRYSDLSLFKETWAINDLACPLAPGKMDYTDAAGASGFRISYTYNLYFGWKLGSNSLEKKMAKVGDAMTDMAGNEFRVLLTDVTYRQDPWNGSSSHPSIDGVGWPRTSTGPGSNIASWWANAFLIDINVIYDDGSARTVRKVCQPNPDERMVKIRYKYDGGYLSSRYLLLPKD